MVLKKKSEKITLNINGISVDCSNSDSVLDAIKQSGFNVPTLRYDERTGPRGSGRSEERRGGKACRARWSPDH